MGAAAGIVSTVVGAAGSLMGGGGGGGVQYVPEYTAANMVSEAYVDYLSQNYDQQLELINQQYRLDGDITDVQYKMYVEQLAADAANEYANMQNAYIQSLAESYMSQAATEFENANEIYQIESARTIANAEYRNTLDSINIARDYRDLTQQLADTDYASGRAGYEQKGLYLDKSREISDKQYELQQRDVGRSLEGVNLQQENLILDREALRDELSSQVSGLNKSREDTYNELYSKNASIANQRRQLMNSFLSQLEDNDRQVANMKALLAAQGMGDTSQAIQQQLALDPKAQRERQTALSGLSTAKGFNELAAKSNLNYADRQEALARSAYSRGLDASVLNEEALGLQREGYLDKSSSLTNEQMQSREDYLLNKGNLSRDEASFINQYYAANAGRGAENRQSGIQEREAGQQRAVNLNNLDVQDLMREYGYDMDMLSILASRGLDEANYANYNELIGSNYDYNSQAALASYWSDLAANATSRASSISGLGSSTSSSMSQLAESMRTTPMVSSSGGGGGANFGGLGKALGSIIGQMGSGGGGNPSGSTSNLYVTSDYGTYPTYTPVSYGDFSGGYSGFISGSI